jgi:NAD(P)-dependent dehydrogenase (short-subunit alcohol dehydrogenase family)
MKAFVTGASSGLGKSCTERLVKDGIEVIQIGRNRETLHPDYPAYVCDLTNEAAVKTMLSDIKSTHGPIEGWVLAAGSQDVRPLMMESASTLQAAFVNNVQTSLGLIAQALKARVIQKGGSVVLFSSAATHAGGAGLVGYAAVKGALEAAARSLALELASQKTRVNVIAPGVIRTPMSEKYLAKLTPEQIAKIETAHPLGFGTPEDVAGAVRFLLSDDSRWITGSTLMIDGGLSIH